MTDAEAPAGVWVSLSDLARQRGLSRSSVKERADRLEAEGLIVTRREGRRRLVELAAFDRAIGEAGSSVKELAAETNRSMREPQSGEYREAQARRANYEAQLKALDLAERRGKVLPISGEHGVEAASVRIGVAIAKAFDGLARHADDVAAAVSKEGVDGARRILKEIGRNERTRIAEMLAAIAKHGGDAERDGPIETQLFDDEDMEN